MSLAVRLAANKKFMSLLSTPGREEALVSISRKVLELFADFASKTVSLVLDPKVGLFFDLVVTLYRSPRFRLHITGRTDLRNYLLSGIAGVLRITEECLEQVDSGMKSWLSMSRNHP